jgi:cell division septation protein DedD
MLGEPAVPELGKPRTVINNFLASLAVIGVLLVGPAAAQPDADGAAAVRVGTSARVPAAGVKSSSAMHWMAFNGDAVGVRESIIAGEDVDGRLKTGATPLHLAAYKGHVEVTKVLIEHGAKVDARTREGVTPLDWAQRNGHERVAMLLIAHGAGQPETPPKQPPAPVSAGQENAQEKEQEKEQENEQDQENTSASADDRQPEASSQSTTAKAAAEPAERSDNKVIETERTQPPAGGTGYRIQLGAFSSEQRARQAWEGYRKKYPDALGGRELVIDRASVKGKDYHRVQAGPLSRQDAWDICNRLKGAGQACAVMRRASR